MGLSLAPPLRAAGPGCSDPQPQIPEVAVRVRVRPSGAPEARGWAPWGERRLPSERAFPHRSRVLRPGRGPDGLRGSVCLSDAAPGTRWARGRVLGAEGEPTAGPGLAGRARWVPARAVQGGEAARQGPGFPKLQGCCLGIAPLSPRRSALRPSGLCGAGPRPPGPVPLGSSCGPGGANPQSGAVHQLGRETETSVCHHDLDSL